MLEVSAVSLKSAVGDLLGEMVFMRALGRVFSPCEHWAGPKAAGHVTWRLLSFNTPVAHIFVEERQQGSM